MRWLDLWWKDNVEQNWVVPNQLLSLWNDVVRVEKMVKSPHNWRVYKHDGDRFQLVAEHSELEQAIDVAKELGPK